MTLFFALVPDAATLGGLVERRDLLRGQHPTPGRWFDSGRYHLTLHAIGATTTAESAWIAKAQAAAGHLRAAPFELRIDQAGSFPLKDHVPWWLGCASTPEPLKQLWRELRDGLKQQGVPLMGSRLTPHLTLIYSAQRDLPQRPVPPLDWPVRDFVLLQTQTTADGVSFYAELGRWALSGRGTSHAPQLDLWDN